MTVAGSAPPTTTQKMSTWNTIAGVDRSTRGADTPGRPRRSVHLLVVVVIAEPQPVARRRPRAAAFSRRRTPRRRRPSVNAAADTMIRCDPSSADGRRRARRTRRGRRSPPRCGRSRPPGRRRASARRAATRVAAGTSTVSTPTKPIVGDGLERLGIEPHAGAAEAGRIAERVELDGEGLGHGRILLRWRRGSRIGRRAGPGGGTTPRRTAGTTAGPRTAPARAGTELRQGRRLATGQPRPDARPEVGHQRDAGAAAAEGVGDAVLGPPDVRHPVEREPDVAAPGVLDPVAGELRMDLDEALVEDAPRSGRSTSAGTMPARRRSSGGPRTRASSRGSSSCRRTSGPWARARVPGPRGVARSR